MTRSIVVVVALFLGAGAMAAEPKLYSAKRGTRVAQIDASVFEVIPRSSGSGPDFWCGAADYAQRVLRAPWSTTLYIARGRGTSVATGRKSSVQFTIDPGAAGVTAAASSLSINSLKPGENMSVQQAFTYCTMPKTRF